MKKNTPWFILFLISRKASQVNQHTLTCKSPIGPCMNQVFLSHTLINKRWQVSTLSLLPSNLSTHTTQIPLFLSLLRILRTYKNSHSLSLFKSKPLTKFTTTYPQIPNPVFSYKRTLLSNPSRSLSLLLFFPIRFNSRAVPNPNPSLRGLISHPKPPNSCFLKQNF